jgi:hypothetical protein
VDLLATILYEDQQGQTKEFGLHKFIVRCVCDEIGLPSDQQYKIYGAVDARQMKGDSKLLKAVWNDLPNIAADGRTVIAVFDNDKIRRLLGLDKETSDNEVFEAILSKCNAPVHLVLLKENTESILRAAKNCGGEYDPETYDRAVSRKEHFARDIIFGKISKEDAKAIRDCIRQHISSIRPLIERVAALLAKAEASNASP